MPTQSNRRSVMCIGACAAFAFAMLPHQVTFAHDFKIGTIQIGHPWSRETPAGAKVAGGYFTIKNLGPLDDRLISASVEIAGRTEIHEMNVKDGVMTMRPLADGVAVPSQGSVMFKPGAYHLMLMDLKRAVKKDEPFEGTLTFEKAGTVKVKFAVDALGAPGAEQHLGH